MDEDGFLEENSEENDLISQYLSNRTFDRTTMVSLAIVFTLLLIIAVLGNGLVCFAIARKRKMWTTRNMFIVNLALSDLLLCCCIMPMSIVEIGTRKWTLGLIACKLTLALENVSMFVSTFSIVAIALVHWKNHFEIRNVLQRLPIALKLAIIWVGGIALAMPLYIFRTIETHKIGITAIDPIHFCFEKWPIEHGRGYYSIFSLIVQYGLPIMIITLMYTCRWVKSTRSNRSSITISTGRQSSKLPLSIFVIFCIVWLPLNVLNIVDEFDFPFSSDFSFRLTFALCHMAGMVSSCCNPFLYGWLDSNFRAEFKEIFHWFKRCFTCHGQSRNSLHNSPNHELVHLNEKKSDKDEIVNMRN